MGKTLIVVLGPTAIGKTDLSIKLAKHFQTEIISCDSRQFFNELDIGVARPGIEQLKEIRHHFIGFLPIYEEFSAGKFEEKALDILDDLFRTRDYVICTGGSMLYVDALINGLDELPSSKETRQQIVQHYKNYGITFLQKQIEELDPEYASAVDLKNPHRLMRAIEVCLVSGKKYSELRKDSKQERNFSTIKIGLNTSREILYGRINQRVDQMMENGLLNEVQKLFEHRMLNSLNTVGYKELFEYIEGSISLNEAVIQIKQHTRNYAKRQLTWWKRDQEILWYETSDDTNLMQRILADIEAQAL